MRPLGFTLETISNDSNWLDFSKYNYDTCIHTLYNGVDWLYTHVETLYIYDYKILYFWFLNSVYDESIDFFFTSV